MSEIKLGVIVGLTAEPEQAIHKVRELGLPTCQVSVWKEELLTPAVFDRLGEAAQAAGVEITTLWTGTPGKYVWNFLQGPATIGIVPEATRAERLPMLKKGAEMAHRLGIPSNATMLYGHLEHPEERVDHLLKIRELQDRSGGFKAFVPLTFHPQNTRMNHLPPPGGFENLRVIAVARLLLDNVPHVKALWMFMGLKMAQVALHFGADDLGGTAFDEEIVRAAGADAPDSVSWQELERVIREAGREPLRTHSGYPESMAESGGI